MSAGCANLLVIGVAVICYCIGYHEGRTKEWRIRKAMARERMDSREGLACSTR